MAKAVSALLQRVRRRDLHAWLDQPISGCACALSWAAATAVFVGLVTSFGGFAGNDSFESVFSTWAVAHGQLACAFPEGYRVTAPLYPLLSGGAAAIAHIGQTVPFPPRQAMGPHCTDSFLAINTWSLQAGAIGRTVEFGYLGWLVLLGGAIALLRATDRGLRRWEPATLILLACLPPVWTCLQSTFHPEDLMAMGFALAAVGCALRGSWVGAGVLIGLAVLSQQFALLVGAPLFVLAPRHRRFAFGEAAAFTLAAVAAPLMVTSSGSAAHAILFGTGTTGGVGGTALWELGLHGVPLLLLSRVAPLALAALIAYGAGRRLGPAALEPVPLVSLIALSLGLRLVFEQNFYEYYLMALCVALVMLDVVRGRLRSSLLAWLVVVPVVYLDMIHLPTDIANLVPPCAVALAALAVVVLAARRRDNLVWACAAWVAVVAAAMITWSPRHFHTWIWQVALVVPGVMLAGAPLLDALRQHATATTRPPRSRASRWEPPARPWPLFTPDGPAPAGPSLRITVPASSLPVRPRPREA